MRKLLLLLIVSLLALLACAGPATALTLPEIITMAAGEEAEESGADGEFEIETEDEEADGEEGCEFADEDCEEEVELAECILEDATAKVIPRPGNNTVQLKIRYQAFAPAAVAIETRLRGSNGRFRLGADHAHFRRAGVFRDNFVLGEREMERALGARQFEVELRALNTPRYCRLDLNGAPRRAKRPLRADGPGRSGDRGPTRGR